MFKRIGVALLAALTISSCVSKKEFAKLESIRDQITTEVSVLERDLNNCNTVVAGLRGDILAKDQALSARQASIDELKERVEELKAENKEYFARIGDMLNNKDLATSEFLEMIKNKDEQLAKARNLADQLNYKIQMKDSINLALVLNLRKSLENINDEDIDIEVRGEVVYVSISDKMLFNSASARINTSAESVLAKVAKVINDNDDIDVMVEGHTDSKSISTDCIKDNWDLSVHRATAIVRNLQDNHGVDPSRITASGKGEFMPKASNETAEGRSKNRRTEIIITPRLDQFIELQQIEE
ncbi:MAG: OmpA family protein [Bacteroidetes bacterium]|nr:OmpA family protein [Bacteroidota bacterium]